MILVEIKILFISPFSIRKISVAFYNSAAVKPSNYNEIASNTYGNTSTKFVSRLDRSRYQNGHFGLDGLARPAFAGTRGDV